MPCQVADATVSVISGTAGQRCASSTTTTKTARRSRVRATSRRAAAALGRAGGRNTTSSAPSSRSAVASAHPARGRGIKTARRRSRPSSAIAATPGSARPTAAHQWPASDAPARRLIASDVAPVPAWPATTMVLPRRKLPDGMSGTRPSATGNTLEDAIATGAIF